MSDIRKDRSDEFKQPLDERPNPHGGHGRGAERKLEEEFTTQVGHPPSDRTGDGVGDRELSADMPPANTGGQHARKGQAQSPREQTHNEPEKKKEGH